LPPAKRRPGAVCGDGLPALGRLGQQDRRQETVIYIIIVVFALAVIGYAAY
jgi:hypothetical protein